MIVAVSMRVVASGAAPEVRDAISHDWTRLLDALSVTPVLVPNVLRDPAAYLRLTGARGLILTGGEDLGPLPGERPGDASPDGRDRTEMALLGGALRDGLPVFGVCRGMQLINACFGGTLTRDIRAVGQHVNVRHRVEVVGFPGDRLGGSKQVETNSYHAQGVLLADLAPDLEVCALAAGGLVEALRHHTLPVLGVQWHPERDNPAAALDRVLLEDWLARCA